MTTMLSPICNVELRLAERQGVEIDHCPQCRGIWLDRGELEKLIERSAMPFDNEGYGGRSSHDREYPSDKHGSSEKHGDRDRRADHDRVDGGVAPFSGICLISKSWICLYTVLLLLGLR